MQNFRTSEEIIKDMVKAKADKDVAKIKELAVEMLLPEATEVMALAKKNVTTKDGYASVWQFTSGLPREYQSTFLTAMARVGYPLDTLDDIKNLMNI
jgi:hypothetical protein